MRSWWLPALAMSTLLAVGCDGDEGGGEADAPEASAEPAADLKTKAKVKAKAKAKAEAPKAEPAEPADPLAEAKVAAWEGDAKAAADLFGAMLDKGPDAWNGFAAAARVLTGTTEIASVLEGKGAVGQRAILMAELKLGQGDTEGAMQAALEARADLPDAAAAMVARAVKAGAALPESMAQDTSDPVTALAKYVTARDARSARAVAETAEAVAGWRAAILRGEVKAGWGEDASAYAEFDKAVSTDDPLAVVVGNISRATLASNAKPKRGGEAVSTVQISTWAAEAAKGAIRNSDVARFELALQLLTTSTQTSLRHDLTTDVLGAAVDAAGGDAAKLPKLRLALANAALEAGLPSLTIQQLEATPKDSPDRPAMQKVALWAYWELGDAEGLKNSGEALSGPHGLAARALSKALQGDIRGALTALPSSGLSEREFARMHFAAADLAGAGAADWLTKAARNADRVGDPALRIQSRLALDDASRRLSPATAKRALDELARMVPKGAAGTALQAELSARQMMLSGTAGFPEGDLPPVVKAWRSLAEGQTVTAEGPGVKAVAMWADGRAALGAGQANTAQKFGKAVEAMPLYRYGRLATNTVLDGSRGVPFAEDLAMLAGREPTEDVLGSALAAHEIGHVLDRAVQDSAVGRDLLAGLDEASRTALHIAAASVRAGMGRWHAGVDDFPAEAFQALEAAEKAAAADSVFRTRVMVSAPPALADIRQVNPKMSILSYVIDRGTVNGLVITDDGGGIKKLGDSRSMLRNAAEHALSLQAGATAQTRISHNGGDALRSTLIDPFTRELSGHGWYLVLGPQDLREFMFTTFPEQASGLRWLADIRTVGLLDVASRINVATEFDMDPERFRKGPDLLAFANPAAPTEGNSEAPPEAPEPPEPPEPTEASDGAEGADAEAEPGSEAAKSKAKAKAGAIEAPSQSCVNGGDVSENVGVAHRFFDPDFRETCVGSDATLGHYFELAPRARYIQLDALRPTASGGFALADGELDLNTVRSIPLVAELVILTADGSPEQQQQRARAFMDAGAQAVLFTGWPVPEGVHERMLDGFWAAVKRDKPISRANAEGRDSLLRDALLGEDRDNPALWGSMILYATP